MDDEAAKKKLEYFEKGYCTVRWTADRYGVTS
jgi:hypothetical protein